MNTINAAVVFQPTKFADVEENLVFLEACTAGAAREGAEIIVFPEFCTTGFALNSSLIDAVPASSKAEARFAQWSHAYGIAVCGSYLRWDARAGDAYNTFGLFFPDGERFFHSKDIPTGLENFCYAPGDCCSVFETPLGRIGTAMCWEQLRWNTVIRMAGKVDFLVGGSCWWNFAPEDGSVCTLAGTNRELAELAPVRLASLLGVPFVHASHYADFPGGTLQNPAQQCLRHIEGKALIVDAQGKTAAEVKECGWAVGQIVPGPGSAVQIPEGRYWIPDLPPAMERGFQTLNENYAKYYTQISRPRLRELALTEKSSRS